MNLDDLDLTRLDYFDIGRALIIVAGQREAAAQKLKPGIKRDNMMARAIRLKRAGEKLMENPEP